MWSSMNPIQNCLWATILPSRPLTNLNSRVCRVMNFMTAYGAHASCSLQSRLFRIAAWQATRREKKRGQVARNEQTCVDFEAVPRGLVAILTSAVSENGTRECLAKFSMYPRRAIWSRNPMDVVNVDTYTKCSQQPVPMDSHRSTIIRGDS